MRSGKAKYSNFVQKNARYIFLTVRFLGEVRKLTSLKPPGKKIGRFFGRGSRMAKFLNLVPKKSSDFGGRGSQKEKYSNTIQKNSQIF